MKDAHREALQTARADVEDGNYARAERQLEGLIDEAQREDAAALVAAGQWELGQCYAAQDRQRDAAKAFAQVAEHHDNAFSSGVSLTSDVADEYIRELRFVGAFLIASGHTDDAETVLYAALSATQHQSEVDAFATGEVHVHLAHIGEARVDARDAEEHYRRAIESFRHADDAIVGVRDERMGWALHRLGEVLQAQDRLVESEPALLEAYTVLQRRYDSNAPELGYVLASLARLYEGSGRFEEAETFFKRSITVGAGHQDAAVVAGRMTELAELYWQAGQHGQAEALFERAIDRMSVTVGSGHSLVAEILQRIADLNWDIGRLDEAAAACERALGMLDDVAGADERDDLAIATVVHQLASLRFEQGKMNAARLFGQRALSVFSALLPGSAEHASSLNLLGQISRGLGDLEAAEPYLMDSIALMVRAAGEDDPRVIMTVNNMAEVCLERGTPANAEGLLRWSLNVAAQHLGMEHPQVGLAVDLLVQVLTALSRKDEAQELLDWASGE